MSPPDLALLALPNIISTLVVLLRSKMHNTTFPPYTHRYQFLLQYVDKPDIVTNLLEGRESLTIAHNPILGEGFQEELSNDFGSPFKCQC